MFACSPLVDATYAVTLTPDIAIGWPSARGLSSRGDSIAINWITHQVAVGCEDHAIRIVDLNSHSLVATLNGHDHPIQALAFSPDGSLLASIDDEGIDLPSATGHASVRIWRTSSWQPLRTVSTFNEKENPGLGIWSQSTSIAFSPDGTVLFWTRPKQPSNIMVVAHSMETGAEVEYLVKGSEGYGCPTMPIYDESSLRLLAAGYLWSVKIHPILLMQQLHPLRAGTMDEDQQLAYDVQSASASFGYLLLRDDTEIRGLDMQSGQEKQKWIIAGNAAQTSIFSLGRKRLIIVRAGFGGIVLDTTEGKVTNKLSAAAIRPSICEDEKWVVAINGDGQSVVAWERGRQFDQWKAPSAGQLHMP
jgi:WD40 repeat protein